MADETNNTYEQVYNVDDDENLYSRVTQVVCLIVQRGLYLVGFNSTRDLLTIHYNGYGKDKPVWSLDFFEHLFSHEELLKLREKVKGVFICSAKNLIVPEELYNESEAKKWLQRIHFTEQTDVIMTYPLESEKAMFLQAVPVNITELVKINFRKAPVLPLPLYHFRITRQQSLFLQCCIMGEQVCVTLHNYSQLLWHRVFDYTTAEDIAYEIKHLCMENNISPSKITVVANATSMAEWGVINDLSQYFSGIKAGNNTVLNSQWAPAISLAQQLLACV